MVNRFKNKKVLIMGLGLHGGAVSVLSWLLKRRAVLTVTDLKTRQQLKASLDKISKLSGSKNIKYTLGKHKLEDFQDQDLIIQNPGVPGNSVYLKQARKLNIPIINEAVLFFGLYPGESIGVTGTRGKSTTSTLIHKILKTEIKTNVVTGNIATNPMMSVLDKLKVKSLPVIELSSWHLETMDDFKVSPHIAVATNLMRDHLNRYKGMKEYGQAKAAIVRHQVARDFCVLNFEDKVIKAFAKQTKAQVYYFSTKRKVKGAYLKGNSVYFYNGRTNKEVMTLDNVKVLGEHNIANILAAITVAKLVGIKDKNIAKAVNSFKGIDYRLEYKGKLGQVEVYNDSTSTTPDAAIAALKSFKNKRVVLIAGGEDKELNYAQLAKVVKSKADYLVLLDGSGSKKLLKELNKLKFSRSKFSSKIDSLSKAWNLAVEKSQNKGVIVFSPAATSFNMFKNEFDRARSFDKLFYGSQKKKSRS